MQGSLPMENAIVSELFSNGFVVYISRYVYLRVLFGLLFNVAVASYGMNATMYIEDKEGNSLLPSTLFGKSPSDTIEKIPVKSVDVNENRTTMRITSADERSITVNLFDRLLVSLDIHEKTFSRQRSISVKKWRPMEREERNVTRPQPKRIAIHPEETLTKPEAKANKKPTHPSMYDILEKFRLISISHQEHENKSIYN